MSDITTRLLELDIFDSLDENELSSIEKISSVRTFEKGEFVFFEGDEAEYFYCLMDGRTKIYKVDAKGNEMVLHNFVAPTLIAEMASIESINLPATCVCLEHCKLILIDKDKFLNILQTNPTMSFKAMKSLAKKTRTLEILLKKSLIFDATTKVSSYIYEDPIEFKNKKNRIIASELHMTPETFSRVLKKLKDLNIIDTEHNLLDKDKLEMFVSF